MDSRTPDSASSEFRASGYAIGASTSATDRRHPPGAATRRREYRPGHVSAETTPLSCRLVTKRNSASISSLSHRSSLCVFATKDTVHTRPRAYALSPAKRTRHDHPHDPVRGEIKLTNSLSLPPADVRRPANIIQGDVNRQRRGRTPRPPPERRRLVESTPPRGRSRRNRQDRLTNFPVNDTTRSPPARLASS